MNKKAIMTSFLITVILAIIIFVPTCYGVSKLFRLSDQAKDSFDNFAEVVKQLPSTENKKTSEIIIIDKGTLLVGFNANYKVQYCAANGACGEISYPATCNGKACLCLCQEYSYESASASEPILCSDRSCKALEGIQFAEKMGMTNFYLTKAAAKVPSLADGYFQQGFILTRGKLEFTIEKGGFQVSRTQFPFEEFRRQFFFLTAQGNTISLCRNKEGCKP